MIDVLQNIISFLVVLGILITVHEYGHFWVARKCGVFVERFSVGFGRVLWRKHDKHGTEFVIAMIPLGGYVKMLDSRVDEVAEKDEDKAFNSKNVYQRIAIIAAGPLANFILAFIAFYFVFLLGVQSVKPIVGHVVENSIAAKAHLPVNSEIIAVNNQLTTDWQAVNLAFVSALGDEHIKLKVKKADSVTPINIELAIGEWQYSPDKHSALTSIGIEPYRPLLLPKIAHIAANSAAEKAGLRIGDMVISANDITIDNNWQKLVNIIQQHPEQDVSLTIRRDSYDMTVFVRPTSTIVDEKIIGVLGVRPHVEPYPEAYIIHQSYGVLSAIPESIDKTWRLIVLSFKMIGKLFTGDVSLNNLSGPISIAQGAGTSASYGVVAFLGFLALISINLGIINLLPLPVLDGGHLAYYFIEMVTGKPVPEKIQEIGFKFGTLALLSLMAIAIFNDLSRL